MYNGLYMYIYVFICIHVCTYMFIYVLSPHLLRLTYILRNLRKAFLKEIYWNSLQISWECGSALSGDFRIPCSKPLTEVMHCLHSTHSSKFAGFYPYRRHENIHMSQMPRNALFVYFYLGATLNDAQGLLPALHSRITSGGTLGALWGARD